MKTETGKNGMARKNEIVRPILLMALGIAIALALMVSRPARADDNPDVPTNLQVPAGNRLFRVDHAIGTQNYVCLSTGWGSPVYAPQATLFDEENEQTLTHFLSPNPDEANEARPTWQDSHDSSAVWASLMPGASYTPDPTAIPWLLLRVVGRAEGPTGGDRLTGTTYIQRLNTTGGLKPTTACNQGDRALVPYTADYFFYRADNR